MRLRFIRRPGVFPLGLVFGLAGFVSLPAFYFLQKRFPALLSGCRFRDWSGWPCPTCGGSRAIRDLLHGRLGEAFLHNPLLIAAVVLLAAWALLSLAVEAVGGREIEWDLSRTEKLTARASVVLLPLLNWGYLIWHQGAR